MAPTICSEKKQQHSNHHHHHHAQHCHHSQHYHHQHQQQQHNHHHQHQLRIKDLRRRVETSRNTAATTSAPLTVSSKSNALTNTTNHQQTIRATTTTTATANVAASAPVSSASLTTSAASATRITPAASSTSSPRFVDFVVAKGALNSATAAAAASAVSFAWRQRRRNRCTEQLRTQISDNVVSSSTHMEDDDSVDIDEADDNIGNNLGAQNLSYRYMRGNGTTTPLSPDSSTRTLVPSSPSVSPNESESSDCYETGDSDTTMDIDDVDVDVDVSGAVKRIHSSSVRSRQQTVTVLKANETKNGGGGGGIGRGCHQQNGLLGIAIKTIKLVQRNQLLQKRLAQLQMETSEFIASVLANPENRHFREKMNNATKAIEPKQRANMLLRH